MNTTTNIRRHRPQKPVKHTPVEIKKEATIDVALHVFNQFVREARKEIRKRDYMAISGMMTKTDCDSVTFYSDSFSLTIDFTEGFTL